VNENAAAPTTIPATSQPGYLFVDAPLAGISNPKRLPQSESFLFGSILHNQNGFVNHEMSLLPADIL